MKLNQLKKGFLPACLLGTIAVASLVTGCHKDDPKPPVVVVTPGVNTKILKLDESSATLGKRLTNGKGEALYFFGKDFSGTKVNCAGGCLDDWKPYLAPSTHTLTDSLPAGLVAADFGTTADGKQTTYKKWPLYYYTPKKNQEPANGTTGDGLGQTWMVAKPDYSLIVVDTTLNTDFSAGDPGTTPAELKFFIFKGATVYYRSGEDAADLTTIKCNTAGCIASWPIVEYGDLSKLVLPSFVDKAKFTILTRTDLANSPKQLVYNGHPLYTFAADNSVRGSVKGQGSNKVWFVQQFKP